MVNYARVLLEMPTMKKLPKHIHFEDEAGTIQQQEVVSTKNIPTTSHGQNVSGTPVSNNFVVLQETDEDRVPVEHHMRPTEAVGGFLDVVKTVWKQKAKGTRMQKMSKKLQWLQRPLRKLNKDHFSEVQTQFATAKENLSYIRHQLQTNPFQQTLSEEEKKLMAEYQLWHSRPECFPIQKTKEDWLNLGDTNDKTFMPNGTWTRDYDRVIKHFTHYYEAYLGSSATTTGHTDDEIIAMGPCLNSKGPSTYFEAFSN
ncbi:hypothetical protein Cgig2_012923 [Carnegiea gigantea]|uniref:Uncharacterized protein n=1 Tax=Carnegiea gigantea TaxID=171969 RepID=A0A9Q1JT51_9CARY|nr:hypothetical protein Cgig2_012923 [Carnegiea gigantea]